MPSAKNAKNGPANHPPTGNRASALRMMNSNQNSDGRISPLDKALKPFRDSFKRSSKNKKAKEKALHASNELSDSSIKDGEQLDSSYMDSSYEEPSPRHEITDKRDNRHDIRHDNGHENSPWSSQQRKGQNSYDVGNNNVCNGSSENCTTDNRGKSSRRVQHVDESEYQHSYYMNRDMDVIAEEDEHHNAGRANDVSYDKNRQKHDVYSQQHGMNRSDRQRHYNNADFQQEEVKREWYVQDKERNEIRHIADENAYFVAPNGDLVKLRKKKQSERSQGSGEQKDNERTERFGKRLSLLCHMLAEKYPEDFHILELLVELQVSNEKREEEMNHSIQLLQKKVDLMEDRLANIEKQSLPGFQKILTPFVRAAGAFHRGILESLTTCKEMENDSRADIISVITDDNVALVSKIGFTKPTDCSECSIDNDNETFSVPNIDSLNIPVSGSKVSANDFVDNERKETSVQKESIDDRASLLNSAAGETKASPEIETKGRLDMLCQDKIIENKSEILYIEDLEKENKEHGTKNSASGEIEILYVEDLEIEKKEHAKEYSISEESKMSSNEGIEITTKEHSTSEEPKIVSNDEEHDDEKRENEGTAAMLTGVTSVLQNGIQDVETMACISSDNKDEAEKTNESQISINADQNEVKKPTYRRISLDETKMTQATDDETESQNSNVGERKSKDKKRRSLCNETTV